MTVGELCIREVVICTEDERVLEAARRMRAHGVGSLVVVEGPAERRVPVGMLTDRDIVVHAVAAGGDAGARRAGDVMTSGIVAALEEENVVDVLKRMRAHGVRRVPVTNAAGVLQGILALDDVLDLLADEMADVARLIAREREHEARTT